MALSSPLFNANEHKKMVSSIDHSTSTIKSEWFPIFLVFLSTAIIIVGMLCVVFRISMMMFFACFLIGFILLIIAIILFFHNQSKLKRIKIAAQSNNDGHSSI